MFGLRIFMNRLLRTRMAGDMGGKISPRPDSTTGRDQNAVFSMSMNF